MALRLKALENIEYLKALRKVRSFYKWELSKKEGLTRKERDKYLKNLKIIDQRIEGKENPDKKKNKYFDKIGGF